MHGAAITVTIVLVVSASLAVAGTKSNKEPEWWDRANHVCLRPIRFDFDGAGVDTITVTCERPNGSVFLRMVQHG